MIKLVAICLFSVVLLSGCGLTKRDLGLSRSVPDETNVETRSPLDLPPDFNVLPE